jgi:hypothetical protein
MIAGGTRIGGFLVRQASKQARLAVKISAKKADKNDN